VQLRQCLAPRLRCPRANPYRTGTPRSSCSRTFAFPRTVKSPSPRPRLSRAVDAHDAPVCARTASFPLRTARAHRENLLILRSRGFYQTPRKRQFVPGVNQQMRFVAEPLGDALMPLALRVRPAAVRPAAPSQGAARRAGRTASRCGVKIRDSAERESYPRETRRDLGVTSQPPAPARPRRERSA